MQVLANMATEVTSTRRSLEPAIESLLGQLRRRIRAYVWADGLAAIVVWLGASFWVSLALDWFFEPPRPLRAFVLAAVVLGLIYVAARYLVSRLFVRLANRNLALVLERRFGQFRDSLLTSVELADEPEHALGFNPQMLAHTHRDALARAGSIELSDVFNVAPLARRISLAIALAASVAVFALAAFDAMSVWARRSLLFSDELWPRKTHLAIDGFDASGHIKIARGSDWPLVVKADAALGRAIPEIVEVRYSTSDGARGRENMSRQGVISPGQAPFQPYTHTFKSVLSSLEFYVHGGDDRKGPYFLDAVDSPTISQMTLHCEYPPYMRRSPRDIPVAGLMELPRGTQITLHAESNKPLVAVQIDDVADENSPRTHQLDLAAEHGQPRTGFEFVLPRLDIDATLLFTLTDSDAIRSREAVRLSLRAVPDEPPQVDVRLKGIGTAVTPNAQLPAVGDVADDYGLAKIWFEFHADDSPAKEKPVNVAVSGQEKLTVADVLEIGDLQLQPKQKLHWVVRAADGFDLESGPNVGSSQQYALDVVTPEQLRYILEARELTLRQRFETIVEEFTDTRNLLAGVEIAPKSPAAERPDEAETKPTGDSKQESSEGPERATTPQVVQVERVLQNSQRSAHETLQVAQAFDDIREEMINNRVDTEELKTRLKDGVADPLRQIVEGSFPPLEEQLKKLTAALADTQAAPQRKAEALAQADRILVEMKQVLDRMLELETFNEVLDMLRQIIGSQEKINAETKQKQKQKLRDLE